MQKSARTAGWTVVDTGKNQHVTMGWQQRLCERFGEDIDLRAVPARPASDADMPDWLHPDVVRALGQRGITRLWSHQAQALDLVHRGTNTVVATGTASGKSLCYQIPMVQAVLAEPGARALYLAPTKALAHDQIGRAHV